MDLNEQLSKTSELLILFCQNKMSRVKRFLDENYDQNFYFTFAKAVIYSAEAGISLKPQKMEEAMNALNESLKLTDSKRKPGYSKHFYVSDYNEFTDEQSHAELCYAEGLLCYAVFLSFSDPGVIAFINAAKNVKIAHECYKLCSRILDNKTNWENENSRLHFESGVRFGIAGFELGFSFLPSKMRKLLSLIGFSGNREEGLQILLSSNHTQGTLRFPFIQLLLFVHNVGFEHIFGLGESDTKIISDIVENWEPKSDNFLIYIALVAVYNHRIGNIKKAIELYEKCLKITKKIVPRLKDILSVAIALCHSIEGNWKLCIQSIQKQKNQFRWSPALFTYFYSVCLFMQMEEENSDQFLPEIQEGFRKIPTLKQKFGGHLAFHEKLVVKRSQIYQEDTQSMILPIYELFYIWNYFSFAGESKEILIKIMKQIDKKMLSVTEKSNFDGFVYLNFLKAVLLRHQNFNEKAIQCFHYVLQSENLMKSERHLQPQAALEMAIIYKNQQNFEEAKRFLKKAKKYNNYLTEVMVKYRVNCLYSSMHS